MELGAPALLPIPLVSAMMRFSLRPDPNCITEAADFSRIRELYRSGTRQPGHTAKRFIVVVEGVSPQQPEADPNDL